MDNSKRQSRWVWLVQILVLAGAGWVVSACAAPLIGGAGGVVPEPTITSMVIKTIPAHYPATPTLLRAATRLPPTASPSVSPTVTPTATKTPLPTNTPTPLPPTLTPMPYQLQLGSPKYAPAFTHADQGCKWLGVAGQVLDASGNGINDLAVLVTGTINGQPVERIALSGSLEAYGPGGYEILLAEALPQRAENFAIQVYDQQSNPLSDRLVFSVPQSCAQNLILVNFSVIHVTPRMFIPAIMH